MEGAWWDIEQCGEEWQWFMPQVLVVIDSCECDHSVNLCSDCDQSVQACSAVAGYLDTAWAEAFCLSNLPLA